MMTACDLVNPHLKYSVSDNASGKRSYLDRESPQRHPYPIFQCTFSRELERMSPMQIEQEA